jgi:hypothetical protein
MRFACMVKVERFDNEVREWLDDERITETFLKTLPESDSTDPVNVRIMATPTTRPKPTPSSCVPCTVA